jgi:hypothetical protein
MTAPLALQWDGEAFVPVARFRRQCDQTYVVGEVYVMERHEDRSAVSHRHFFAAIREAWMNLPDDAADRFRSPEALRKFTLIKAGYADSQSIVCASKAEASRVAGFMRPIDEFAVITVEGATVTRWTAKSQSQNAMGKKVFGESKQRVLEVLADMIGTSTGDLAKQAEAA